MSSINSDNSTFSIPICVTFTYFPCLIAICGMDESARYYSKYNKSGRERHMSYTIMHMWNLVK